MKLVELTQVVIKMPDMPPEVMQGMSQDEIMEAQEVGDDQQVYINPDFVLAIYPNQHPKVDGGAVITLQAPAQMPPQIAVRQSVEETVKALEL